MNFRNEERCKPTEASHASSSCLGSLFFSVLMAVIAAILLGVFMASETAGEGPDCKVSVRYPQDVRQWCSLITKQAEKNDLHPDLVAALIWQESGGNSLAYSHSGAVGLMQVMPRDGLAEAFVCNGSPCFTDRPTMRQLQDPTFNVRYGTKMLRGLVEKNRGDLREALRQYGPIDVGYSYADTVLSIFQQYTKN